MKGVRSQKEVESRIINIKGLPPAPCPLPLTCSLLFSNG